MKKGKYKPYSTQQNWSNTYLTDPNILNVIGPFDTDPCVHTTMPWETAKITYNINQDGLTRPWYGRVFMNPPYRGVMKWAEKFVQCESGIALLNGRATETRATQLIMRFGHSIWFPNKRLTWYKPDGTEYERKWFPSLFIGKEEIDTTKLLEASLIFGGQVFIH